MTGGPLEATVQMEPKIFFQQKHSGMNSAKPFWKSESDGYFVFRKNKGSFNTGHLSSHITSWISFSTTGNNIHESYCFSSKENDVTVKSRYYPGGIVFHSDTGHKKILQALNITKVIHDHRKGCPFWGNLFLWEKWCIHIYFKAS